MKIFENKNKFMGEELTRIKDIMSKTLDQLPNKELPFMENHLRSLYFQAYFLIVYGFYNASLVICGILLENIAKERLFNNGMVDIELEKLNFGQTISECAKRKILTPKELTFLMTKKTELRNPYAHHNKIKLTAGKYLPIKKIHSVKLMELVKMVGAGKLTPKQFRSELIKGEQTKLMDSRELRPLAQIIKGEEDKKNALPIFLEIDKFTRNFAKKYFNTDK